jgi:hypothetical protein
MLCNCSNPSLQNKFSTGTAGRHGALSATEPAVAPFGFTEIAGEVESVFSLPFLSLVRSTLTRWSIRAAVENCQLGEMVNTAQSRRGDVGILIWLTLGESFHV